jgi:hypothetical protein
MDRARLLTSNVTERAQAGRRLATESWTRSLAHALTRLSSTADLASLGRVTREVLPGLGIRDFFLATYANPTRSEATTVAAFSRAGALETGKETSPFASAQLMPERWAAPDAAHHFIVEPLYDADGPLGYAVFGVGTCDGYAYELMREVLSAAVKRTLGPAANLLPPQ